MTRNSTKSALTLGFLVALGISGPLAAATTESFSTLTAVRMVREGVAWSTPSAVWVDVPGATTTFVVAPNHTDVYLARFAAESSCWGVAGWCSVRILVNGVEMQPATGAEYAFDSTGSVSDYEGHAVERSLRYTAASTSLFAVVTVKVQAKVSVAAGLTFRLDDWHFTVEQGH